MYNLNINKLFHSYISINYYYLTLSRFASSLFLQKACRLTTLWTWSLLTYYLDHWCSDDLFLLLHTSLNISHRSYKLLLQSIIFARSRHFILWNWLGYSKSLSSYVPRLTTFIAPAEIFFFLIVYYMSSLLLKFSRGQL